MCVYVCVCVCMCVCVCVVAVIQQDYSEDHIAHLIWNFMAIYHVLCVFPHMNDLVNFEALKQQG